MATGLRTPLLPLALSADTSGTPTVGYRALLVFWIGGAGEGPTPVGGDVLRRLLVGVGL